MVSPVQGRANTLPIAIKGMREELECAICRELCTEPKTLPCLHSFCHKCLKEWVDSKILLEGNNVAFLKHFECPFCRAPSDLSSGTASLRTNFSLKTIIEHVKVMESMKNCGEPTCAQCVDDEKEEAVSFCNSCQAPLCQYHVQVHRKSRDYVGHTIVSLEEASAQTPEERRKHSKSLPSPDTLVNPNICQRHNEQLQWYCMTCENPICIHCTAKDHKDHSFEFINERLAQDEKEMIEENFKPVEDMIPQVMDCCAKLQQCLEKLEATKKTLKNEIEQVTELRREEIQQKGTLLSARLDDKYFSMKKELSIRLEELNHLKDSLVGSVKYMKLTIQTAPDVDLLMSKKQLLARADTLQQTITDTNLKIPETNGDLCSCYTLETVPAVLGHIRERVKSVKCELNQVVAKQGMEMSVKVSTHGVQDHPLRTGGASCEGFFQHLDKNMQDTETIPCRVTDHNNGTYSFSCIPPAYGPGKVTISFSTELVQELSLNVSVVRSYDPLIPNPTAIELHCSPWGVALLRNNQLAVSTSDKDVRIFDINTQQKVATVNSNFVRPYAMTEDKDGNLWVTDREAHNIQKFRYSGEGWHKVVQVGCRGREEGKFAHPRGIAVHPNSGLLYVSDMRNHRIQVFLDDNRTNEPRVMNSFGTHGADVGQLDQPASLAFNKRGQLVVCDDRNGRLQLFNHNGGHVDCVGVTQTGIGLLCSPIGVALDNHGRYVIGEFGSHAVSFLSPEGKLLGCVRTAGGDVGEFLRPRGVAVDAGGRIYVADFQNERIVIL